MNRAPRPGLPLALPPGAPTRPRRLSRSATTHGIDLDLGLALTPGLMSRHEGPFVARVSLAPVLAIASLATVLSVATHDDARVARFL